MSRVLLLRRGLAAPGRLPQRLGGRSCVVTQGVAIVLYSQSHLGETQVFLFP